MSTPQQPGPPAPGQYGQGQFPQGPGHGQGQGQFGQPPQGPGFQQQFGAPGQPFQPQQRARREPGAGVLGPFTLRELLILIGALVVLVGLFLPAFRFANPLGGPSYSLWIWHWGYVPVIVFGFLTLIAAGVLTLLQKTVAGLPPRLGSFSIDQVVSALAIAGAGYNFLRVIAQPTTASWGTYVALLGSLLVVLAASLTFIPAFGADFRGRKSVEAHPKARAVVLAVKPRPAQNFGAPGAYGQPGPFGQPGQPGPQGQFGQPAPGGFNQPPSQQGQQFNQPGPFGQPAPFAGNAPAAGPFGQPVSQFDPSTSQFADAPIAAEPTPERNADAFAAAAQAQEQASFGEAAAEPVADVQADALSRPAGNETEAPAAEAPGTEAPAAGVESDAQSVDAGVDPQLAWAANAEQAVGEAADDTHVDSERAEEAAYSGAEPAAGTSVEGAAAAAEPAQAETEYQAFWFAVPEERPAHDERTGQPVFPITPGTWFLALEDHGSYFKVQSQDGQQGILHDVTGIQRG